MIHTDIKQKVKEAMLAKDQVRLLVLRNMLSAFTNELVAKKRKPDELLSDEDAIAVITRLTKQRKDSIEQFTNAGRAELAEPEQEELGVISTLLPAQLTREEIEAIVKAKVEEMGFSDKSQMGKFMGVVMKEMAGNADGTVVKEVIEALLA